jgi:hypothetical protein
VKPNYNKPTHTKKKKNMGREQRKKPTSAVPSTLSKSDSNTCQS